MEMIDYIIIIAEILLFVLPFIIIRLIAKKSGNKYITFLKSEKEKKNFRYIDNFYISDPETMNRFALIEDVNSKELYAIKYTSDIDLYKRYKNKDINYGDTGSFWIARILDNNYIKEGHLISYDNVQSNNPSFDTSILNKVIFINGHHEYDKYNN